MKKICLPLILLIFTFTTQAQTLFSYGTNLVDKSEFLRAFNKNNNVAGINKEKAIQDYLDLYIKFKLKVKAAQDLKLDTLPQLVSDLDNFKSQIADSYLNNDKIFTSLTDEAFDRSQKDLHVIHFFIPIDTTLKPIDTTKAFNAIFQLQKELNNNSINFDNVVTKISNNTYPITSNDLGFITAFTLPYTYENIVYNLKNNETSQPYRSKKGWHCFKLIDERQSIGRWKIAQILLAINPSNVEQSTQEASATAKVLYAKIKAGEDFGKLAKEYSNDKISYLNNGEMPEFGTGRYASSFENEVLKLKKVGEVSSPFLTTYGYHIIKKLAQTPTPTTKDDITFLETLKQKVQQDSRINIAKEIFAQGIIKKIGYKRNLLLKDADLFKAADEVNMNPSTDLNKMAIANKPIFSFEKTNILGKEWLQFVKSNEGYYAKNKTQILNNFINASALNFYKNNLSKYNSDYKYQLQEFKDGNSLFEIMEKNVWGKAANDNAGLQKIYADNKSKYTWAQSAAVIIFNCANKDSVNNAMASLNAGKNWKLIAEESNGTIQADSGRYEISQIPLPANEKPTIGVTTKAVINNTDGSASFLKILKLYSPNEQRSFEESRGLLINDYQNILEEKWLSDLKKKYPIKINQTVLNSILK